MENLNTILSASSDDAFARLSSLGLSDGRRALNDLKALSGVLGEARTSIVLQKALLSPSPDNALNNLERIASESPALLSEVLAGEVEIARLVLVSASSQMLTNIILRNPDYLGWLFREGGLLLSRDLDGFVKGLEETSSGAVDFDSMARALRLYKQKEFLRIGARDLLGLSEVEEVTREISDLASAALDAALAFSLKYHKSLYGAPLFKNRDGETKEAGFTVMGLGKLGGRELNFSSDIDIIYIYSSDNGETAGLEGRPETRLSLHAFFVKVSMMLNKLISGPTGDGFVFRVDLDLRPEGRSGDMANSLRSAEIYYESWGQSWERAAMIKARPVAGSPGLGEEFLSMIRPFVWRRYLDFSAIEEIKSMKEKIDLSLLRRNPDSIDVKLGAGGIREIEFFCQALELIHGGKDARIRQKNTLAALDRLSSGGYIKDSELDHLREGYRFLRRLEHRIQIVEGRQSQAIPAVETELERLARMMGFADTPEKKAAEAFREEYRKKTGSVHEVYRTLFYKTEGPQVPEEILLLSSPDLTKEEALVRLMRLGFKDPETAYKNMGLLRTGPAFVHLSARANLLLQKLSPVFLARSASAPDPDRALSNLERFISSVGARTTFYSLLSENPRVLDELVKLFGTSEFLSRGLIEHPESLDLLLSKELGYPYRSRNYFFDLVEEALRADEYEDKLDVLRRLKNQEVFRIGINDIMGHLTARQVSVQLTLLAQACLHAAWRIADEELKKTYGSPGEGGFSIIGLGKLGSRELIYGSDLDIIFIYNDSERTTGGARPIAAHEYCVKLGQRIISVLTLRTKEGFVFNIDTRLRPSGSSGPLVVSRQSLLKYHSSMTSVWERQAFTRARPVAADTAFATSVLKELGDIIYSRALTEEDIDEMLRIRERMEAEIAKETAGRYNLKSGRGGLVDIEFLVQALQLSRGRVKGLDTQYTAKALLRLKRLGIIPEESYNDLKNAYRLYRSLEMKLRIVHDRPEGHLDRGTGELLTLSRRAGYTGPDPGLSLMNDYEAASRKVRRLYVSCLEDLRKKARAARSDAGPNG